VRRVAIAVSVLASGLAVPAAAEADHLHVAVLGNGSCVILAQAGHERDVVLPAASFQNTTEPTTTANPHPLHVHLHRGQPGDVRTIAVYGSAADPCRTTGDYINAP
jgi:hypothetical protein